ncbi:hypothetical protein [Solimicrobium silvestre]|uniref:Uncharacterized protein n=1 Tax=Solimicrobium silvestre TaxID=2099400 RepID=A0A2S9GYF0_9BURK|nr:hypothetical protein [Solimicrobium silvestre]PRC92749.1 hypothetical protein S2091_2479 [Solimicrobium silvestre]
MTPTTLLLICVVLTDLALNFMLVPFYFQHGIVVFRRKIKCDQRETPIPSIAQIEVRIPSSIWPDFLLKEIDPIQFAFRERVFKSMMTYTPIMHGVLRLDTESGYVVVTGRLNWTTLAFIVFAFFNLSDHVDLSFGFMALLILSVIYLIQAIRYSQIANTAAIIWRESSSQNQDQSNANFNLNASDHVQSRSFRLANIPAGAVVGIGIASFVLAIHFIGAKQDPYGDLETAFKSTNYLQTKAISPTSVGFTSPDRKYSKYKGTMDIRLSADAMELDPTFPSSISNKKIVVPMNRIAACSRTCSGDNTWSADILIDNPATEIAVTQSQEVLEWCWDNHIPMVSGKDRRAFVYTRTPVPERSRYTEQLSSKAIYMEQGRQSCLGY